MQVQPSLQATTLTVAAEAAATPLMAMRETTKTTALITTIMLVTPRRRGAQLHHGSEIHHQSNNGKSQSHNSAEKDVRDIPSAESFGGFLLIVFLFSASGECTIVTVLAAATAAPVRAIHAEASFVAPATTATGRRVRSVVPMRAQEQAAAIVPT